MDKTGKENLTFSSSSSVSVTDTANIPQIYPPHWHNAAEFTVALKDGCVYRINETTYTLSAGDLLLVWPGQIHESINVPSESAFFIQFPSVILENNLDLVSVSGLLYDQHHISSREHAQLASYVSDRIFTIQKIHNSQDPLSETRCKLCIYEILLRLGEEALSENREDPAFQKTAGSGWRYIRSACNYIRANAGDDITQADVAKQVGLSSFYFSKLFKQYMHQSFPAYLAGIRVKAAAGLLLDNSLSITECAFLSGFQSTTAFNKAFHEITGYAPRDYRKLYR
ncbi:MAG: AraC family transcriptional regulator [Lachnospiraceae bacterium]|nr:AraC family transcriptional regulator [Lachnospiraceae bacterium]